MNITSFCNALWHSYVEITPQAQAIHDLFTARHEKVVNDHVAFRTLSDSPIAISRLEPTLTALGYRRSGDYRFDRKKLLARSYKHADPDSPKIFLSELQRHQLSGAAQQILADIVSQIPQDCAQQPSIFWQGLLWQAPTVDDYRKLTDESEYAAWFVTMGLRANHFTVSLNHLQHLNDLRAVIDLLKQNGLSINTVGGEIKGSPQTRLEQAATLADSVCFEFSDGQTHPVPSCFYEFAKRYPMENGELFQGFVTDNADKIFESTHATTSST